MNKQLKNKLLAIAKREIKEDDPSHDFEHAVRVLKNAEMIAKKEGGDTDIIIPAALFHDLVVYPKDSPRSDCSTEVSAKKTKTILKNIPGFPQHKIATVQQCICNCSFSRGTNHAIREAQIIQDADWLEATGAISIMRTYASTGQMKRPFYNAQDPFCRNRKLDDKKFALDHFFIRLLKVHGKMYTPTAKKIAKRRTDFLKKFLTQLKLELKGK